MLTRTRINLPATREPSPHRDPFTTAFAGLRELQNAMEGFFGDLYRGTWGERSGMSGMGINAYLRGDTYMVECAIPGVDRKDIEVTVEGDLLCVRATFDEHETIKHEDFDVHELRCGQYQRELRVPFEIAPDKVEANYADGILRINLRSKTGVLTTGTKIEVRG